MAFLADGDVTKKEYIYWNVTVSEAQLYAKLQARKVLFREAVIGFIVGDKTKNQSSEEIKQIAKEKKQKWLQKKK